MLIIGFSVLQVQNWFQNRKASLKKQNSRLLPPSSSTVLRNERFAGDPNDEPYPERDVRIPPGGYVDSMLHPNDILYPGFDVKNPTVPPASSTGALGPSGYDSLLFPHALPYPPSFHHVGAYHSGHLHRSEFPIIKKCDK